MKKFGEVVKLYRKKQNINQEGLAFLSGISRPTIAKIERGFVGISLFNAIKLSKILFIDLSKIEVGE